MFILSALVIIVIVANIHTLARMFKALIFSHRKHLLSAIAKFDTMSAEGYIPRLKEEVNLMVEMVSVCRGCSSCMVKFGSMLSTKLILADEKYLEGINKYFSTKELTKRLSIVSGRF